MYASEKEKSWRKRASDLQSMSIAVNVQFPVSIPFESMPTSERSYPSGRNLRNEKDIENATNCHIWILSPLGLWPESENKHQRLLSKALIVLNNFIMCFAIVPCVLHIVYEEKDTTNRLKLLGLLSFCVCSTMKYFVLVMRKPMIRKCVEHVKRDWKLVELHGDREVMLKHANLGRSLTIICASFMYSGGMFYHTILQFIAPPVENAQNDTMKPVVYPTYSPMFNVQMSPVYELVFFAHCMCGYVMYSVAAGVCAMAALFATHACGQVDIVMSRIERLVDGDAAEPHSDVDQRLTVIIECHLRVLRFATMIDQMLQEVCLMEFVGSTCLICLLEYYCITDWEQSNALSLATYGLLLVSLTFNIFILCLIGELLTEKSGNVGIKCFMIDWYRLPVKTMRDLILVIAISNNPIKISAGRMADLTLFSFGTILKTSLAYLSILRTAVM